MDGIFEIEYKIKHYDVDNTNKATILALAEYMQEAATISSEQCGLGRKYLQEKSEGWILLQSKVKIFSLPRLGDKIKVRTWPKKSKGIYIIRQYEILDEKDNQLCVSTSKWIIYSFINKLPVRLNDDILSKYTYSDRSVIEDTFNIIKDSGKYEKIVLQEVLYRDIDTNWHMNNIKYIRNIIESMDNEFLNKYTVDEYIIKYKHQLVYANKFDICINKVNEKEYMYYLKEKNVDLKDNNCEMYIKWKEK